MLFPKSSGVTLKEFRVRWRVLVPLTLLHLGAIAAFWHFTWGAFSLAVLLWATTGVFGITVGYHRLLTHQSFETYPVVKWFHLFCASLTLQQGPISWVRLHRAHHAYSDTPADPHPQTYGFFFGHCGWAFLSHATIGRSEDVRRIPRDLAGDPVIQFFENWHYPLFFASLVFFYLVGGLPYLLWAGCFRTAFTLHTTWSVNSLSHRIGYRNFATKDSSTNSRFVSLLTLGEGWHNNHHRYPSSAKQGMRLSEPDFSWAWIQFLRLIGLAWNVRVPSGIFEPAAAKKVSDPAS